MDHINAYRNKSIPVAKMAGTFGEGVAIEKLSVDSSGTVGKAALNPFEESKQAHRHDRHCFFLLECGSIHVEIDFQKYEIESPSVIYIHPDQVHRTTAFDNVTVSSWAINNENLAPEYLKLLKGITPAKPLALTRDTFNVIVEAVSLCLKLSERRHDKLYHSMLKDGCNALVALVVSQYLAQAEPAGKLSRFELVTKAFSDILERDYATAKRPAAYARQLNISTPYLNECVKNATGYSVSYHLQQRVVLEAKRLLVHSDKAVKEIAAALGYDDCPYFSRLFTKVAGMTALAFRAKNRH